MRRRYRTPPCAALGVLNRDVSCVAPRIDPGAGPCADEWGNPTYRLEVDHVRTEPGALTSPHSMIALCPWHHRVSVAGRVWATSHRAELRDYLRAVAWS